MAPTDMPGRSQSLCPAIAANWAGSYWALILATLAIPPHVSFTPTMFSCEPSLANISELTSIPAATPGKL